MTNCAHTHVTPTGFASGVRDNTRASAWCNDCGGWVRRVGTGWATDSGDELLDDPGDGAPKA